MLSNQSTTINRWQFLETWLFRCHTHPARANRLIVLVAGIYRGNQLEVFFFLSFLFFFFGAGPRIPEREFTGGYLIDRGTRQRPADHGNFTGPPNLPVTAVKYQGTLPGKIYPTLIIYRAVVFRDIGPRSHPLID